MAEYRRSPQDLVNQEVLCCMSHIVATLAGGAYGAITGDSHGSGRLQDLEGLCEQASELAAPIDDWEEAAIQAGYALTQTADDGVVWRLDGEPDNTFSEWETAETLCQDQDVEPYQREVFEHWAVTDWLADKLEAHGEKVDKDFGGLCIWARTTTGQAIYADGVIEHIAGATA